MAGTIEDQLNLMNVADVGDSGLDAETLGAEPVRISAPDSARERRSSSADEDLHFLATTVKVLVADISGLKQLVQRALGNSGGSTAGAGVPMDRGPSLTESEVANISGLERGRSNQSLVSAGIGGRRSSRKSSHGNLSLTGSGRYSDTDGRHGSARARCSCHATDDGVVDFSKLVDASKFGLAKEWVHAPPE